MPLGLVLRGEPERAGSRTAPPHPAAGTAGTVRCCVSGPARGWLGLVDPACAERPSRRNAGPSGIRMDHRRSDGDGGSRSSALYRFLVRARRRGPPCLHAFRTAAENPYRNPRSRCGTDRRSLDCGKRSGPGGSAHADAEGTEPRKTKIRRSGKTARLRAGGNRSRVATGVPGLIHGVRNTWPATDCPLRQERLAPRVVRVPRRRNGACRGKAPEVILRHGAWGTDKWLPFSGCWP